MVDDDDIEQEMEHSAREASCGFLAFTNLDLALAATLLRRLGPVPGRVMRPSTMGAKGDH